MRILTVDLGTSSVKLMRMDEHARALSIDRIPMTGLSAERWIDALRENIEARGDGPEIDAIAVTGQMHGLMTRENHAAWGDGIPWHDNRSASLIPTIREAVGPDAVTTTGGPIVPGFLAASLAWVRANDPGRWGRITSVHLPKDALVHDLTGAHVTDPSDAVGTGLYAPASRDWAWPIVDALGAPREWLPCILPSGSIAGTLTPEAARRVGLPEGIPVVVAGGDAPVGAFGAGLLREGEALVMLSTGAQVILPSDSFAPDVAGRWYTWSSVAPETNGHARYLKVGTLLNAGNATAWSESILAGDDISDRPSGLIAIPYLIGTREDPARTGAIIGLTADTTAGDMRRAILEGIAFSVRTTLEEMTEASEAPSRIRLGGGLAHRQDVRQLFADVLGTQVEAVARPEVTAFGAGLLALHTLSGLLPDEVMESGDVTTPKVSAAYDASYALYRDIDQALSPLSGRIGALRTEHP